MLVKNIDVKFSQWCSEKKTVMIEKKGKLTSVKFSQWCSEKKTVMIEKKGKLTSVEKSVFSLYPVNCKAQEALVMLQEMCKPLKLHIFTAHMQWHAHSEARQNLDLNTIISIEDYQMNIEIVYKENPTSLAYSTNKMTVAMYPICVEYLTPEETIAKMTITFISDDKDHSHQQVQQFEQRMFKILSEKLNCPITNWIRYNDGCGAQFKSGYVVSDMFHAPKKFGIKTVTFNFFESHEGKSTSDSIGSIVKCAFIRGMLKNEQGVSNIDDILNVVTSETKPSK